MELTDNKVRKELEKLRCEILVRQEINNIKFNTDMHKKVISFIFFNIILNFFFAWCSSSEESNLPQYISSHEWAKAFIVLFPSIVLSIFLFAIVLTTKNMMKKVNFQSEMTNFHWNKKYQWFILEKIGFKAQDTFKETADEINKIYREASDIEFYEDEFERYISESYKKYKMDVSFDFYKNLARAILLENELKGSLISEGDKYTFIPKDNPEFSCMAIVNAAKKRYNA